MKPSYLYKAKITKVVDGDTVDAIVDLGFGISFKDRFRLYGVNTPETRTKDKAEKQKGLFVKQFVKDQIEGKEVIIKTHKKGKFGRYLAEIFMEENKISLNKMLISSGYAVEYFGGRRK